MHTQTVENEANCTNYKSNGWKVKVIFFSTKCIISWLLIASRYLDGALDFNKVVDSFSQNWVKKPGVSHCLMNTADAFSGSVCRAVSSSLT